MCPGRTFWFGWLATILVITIAGVRPAVAAPICRVSEYGARGDGRQYDTRAIQAAVNRCAQPGQAGTVVFDEGKEYLTGTILLTGSVHVYLPSNSTLLLGVQREDFGATQAEWYLLLFLRCTNCSITGSGRLDARGRLWVTGNATNWLKAIRNFQDPSCKIPGECRPRLLGVKDSQQVQVTNIELFDSIYWTLHILGSTQVTVTGVTVNNDFAIPNNDGIDVDSSKQVWISGCRTTTWDDGICVKANYPGVATEDVLIENCIVKSRAAALKIGTESLADFRRIVFQNNQVFESHRGLAMQLRDNGTMKDVVFSNNVVETRQYNGTGFGESEWGEAEPIYVTALPRTNQTKVGSISGVTFQGIKATSESGILVVASPNNVIECLTIQDMDLQLVSTTSEVGGFHDLRPGIYGIVQNVSDDAVYLEHANNVTLSDLRVTWGSPARPTWGQLLSVKPQTVKSLNAQGLTAYDQSALVSSIGKPVSAWSSAPASLEQWAASLRTMSPWGSGR